MNHHLRFSSKPVRTYVRTTGALALTAALLTSCSTTKAPTLTPPKPHPASARPTAVKLNTYFFSTPDGYMPPKNKEQKPEIQIYSAEDGAKLVKKLQRHRKCHPLIDPSLSVVTKPKVSSKIELIREFVYPTEYDPPKIPKEFLNSPNPPVFPVTPATPTSFVKRTLGITAQYEVHNLEQHAIEVGLHVHREMFLGNINYGTPITGGATDFFGRAVQVVITENKILMPVFQNAQARNRVTVKPGDFIAIRGLNPRDLPKVDSPFEPAPDHPSTGGANHMMILIEVTPITTKASHN